MDRNGNLSCLPSTMVFGLLLLAVFVILTSASARVTTGSSKRSTTSQSTTSQSTTSRLIAAHPAPTLSAPIQPAPVQPAQAQEPPSQSTYYVKSGDDLSSIAAQTGVPLSELEEANPQVGPTDLIYPGEAIDLPPAIPVTGSESQAEVDLYTVQPGDTLFRLALRFHTTVSALLSANPQITDPRVIFPGQQLEIP